MANLKEFITEQVAGDQEYVVSQQEKIHKKVEIYKVRVAEFYESVLNEWLKDLNDDNLLSPTMSKKIITEELTGSYEVDTLQIKMGKVNVRFDPIGTILIGTPGRIDMYVNGDIEPQMFILAGERATGPRIITQTWVEGESKPKKPKAVDYGPLVWKYVVRNGIMRYENLTTDSFQQIIQNRIQK